MQRAYSDQTTPLEYNRQLADYYREQIAVLQGQPRSTSLTPPADDIIEPVQEEPSYELIDATQRITLVLDPKAEVLSDTVMVTSLERNESYESASSVLVPTPDTFGSSKPASPLTPNTKAAVGGIRAKQTKSKAKAKTGSKGIRRMFRRWNSEDD
ncbi:hypothetical protein LTR22_014051 [Elasticomyces elasticus]|nr:hypothetical protein LTR22_014051 [Elasticomyces elasticus]